MKKIYTLLALILICFAVEEVNAAKVRVREKRVEKAAPADRFVFAAKAGFNLGGTAPMGLPAEIRSLNSFKPTFSFTIAGTAQYNFNNKWGLQSGVKFDIKGMQTDATVKNYQLVVSMDGSTIEGVFTGDVTTKVHNSYITLPVLAVYDISPRWDIKFGGYVSFMVNGEFSGTATNGYMRDGSPIGPRVDGVDAVYDFSNDMRKVDAGIQVGVDFIPYKHLLVSGDLTWGCMPLFKSDFTAMSFNMYNVYFNIGFGYVF
ncbi:MAG: PorT family protein [Bacteroidales bacterium]|nr:PorT family protein [Bacteroidales bacterium]